MKTKSLINTLILIVLMGITGIMNAQVIFTVGDLEYYENEPGGVSVTLVGHVDGWEATGELVIPESITYMGMNLAVTAIADHAFSGCSGLTGSLNIPNSIISLGYAAFYGCCGFTGSLAIPNSISSISSDAFYECSGFSNLIIPNSVTNVEDNAFAYCTGFTGALNIPNSITNIGELAFAYCSGFTGTLNIPNSVTHIESCAFYGCSGLTSINIPNSVTHIGSAAFSGCSGLTSINIPNSVTHIGSAAFSGCSGLTSINIPNSVTEIEDNPFSSCSELAEITVDSNNPVFDSRNDCNAIVETTSNTIVSGCKNTTIPPTISTIGGWSFTGCTGLYHIDFPNSVQSIMSRAFADCSNLNDVNLPNSVTHIDYQAFSGSGISSIHIPSSVNFIGKNPFSYCPALEEIIVDANNTVYDSRNDCNAIIHTASLKLVSGCKNTVIPDNINTIGYYAFAGQGLTGSLIIPQSVTILDDFAFSLCDRLTGTLIIPSSITSIGEQAFDGCSGFTGSLIIPNSVTNIGYGAFGGCTGFDDTLVIGSSVTEIGGRAFAFCTGFNEAISLASIPPTLETNPWEDMTFYYFGCDTLTVPCGCSPAYLNSNWHDQFDGFSTILEDCSSVPEFDENSVSLYPNPTSGSINIEAENIQSISIYNMLGEKVFESAVHGDSFNYDFSGNEKGIYIIRIQTAQGIATKKVTVK